MSTTDNLEQKAREWKCNKHDIDIDFNRNSDFSFTVDEVAAFARSLAPAKELSEEEIDRIAHSQVQDGAFAAARKVLRYARDNGFLSPAPPPSGAVVDFLRQVSEHEIYPVTTDFDNDLRDVEIDTLSKAWKDGYQQHREQVRHIIDAFLSSHSEPTVDEQVEKIMAECQRCYTDGLAGNRGWSEYRVDLRNRIKSLLSK